MKIDWQLLGRIIEENDRFVLSSHVRPDADALGSEMALALMLESRGKQVRIINPSAAPENVEFIDPENRIQKIGEDATAADVQDTDVHVVLDTSAWSQLQDVGKAMRDSQAKKVVIDHHVSSDDLGAIEFKDTTAEATGALVFRMAQELGLPIDARTATCLYAAIATDTGWFRFPSTTAETLRIVAKLMEQGAEPPSIHRQLYERYSLARLKLKGRALGGIETAGELAYMAISRRDFAETGARPADTEDLVNECLRIDGMEVAFIAVEQLNGQVKFSLRSRGPVNVAQVAEQFGGGGHKAAAGTMLRGPLTKAVERVRTALVSAIEAAETTP